MGLYRVELRGAIIRNGKTKEVSLVDHIEASEWIEARVFAARRHGVDVDDPAMFAVLVDPEDLVAPKKRRAR